MMKRLTAIIVPALLCFAVWSAAPAGSARAAASLSGPGEVDPSFNPIITTQFGPTFINAITVQPDGKILVGGFFDAVNGTERQGLARLNVDGSLDTTFNPPLATPTVKAIALQPDGKILVGGGFDIINTIRPTRMIVRLNSDGSLDTTFNLVPSQTFESVSSIAVEPDGNILIGGASSSSTTRRRTGSRG